MNRSNKKQSLPISMPMCVINVEELTDPTKTILKECYYENKKYQEVADEFGISTNGVKKHIMKALRLIREEFGIKKKSREVPENEVKTYIPYKE